MPITWYAPKPKQSADVKITKSSIVISEAGFEKLIGIDQRFSEAGQVKLGWDPSRKLMALAPAADGEKGAFKVSRRARNRTVNAAKFFAAFELMLDETSPNVPVLSSEDGVAVFKLNVRGGVDPSGTVVRRRRGRVPKAPPG